MKIAVRYYTRSGNTKKLAEAVADAVSVDACDISVPLPEKTDIVFLGCSCYAFDIDEAVRDFIMQNRDFIGKIVCIGTSAMMKSLQKPVSKAAEAAGVSVASEEFHCRGAFGPMHRGRPNAADLKKAADFARKITMS